MNYEDDNIYDVDEELDELEYNEREELFDDVSEDYVGEDEPEYIVDLILMEGMDEYSQESFSSLEDIISDPKILRINWTTWQGESLVSDEGDTLDIVRSDNLELTPEERDIINEGLVNAGSEELATSYPNPKNEDYLESYRRNYIPFFEETEKGVGSGIKPLKKDYKRESDVVFKGASVMNKNVGSGLKTYIPKFNVKDGNPKSSSKVKSASNPGSGIKGNLKKGGK